MHRRSVPVARRDADTPVAQTGLEEPDVTYAVTVASLSVLAGAASANLRTTNLPPTSLNGGIQTSATPRSFTGTGFEADEGYVPGTIAGQQGWTGFVNPGANAASNVASSGNPGQSLRLTKNGQSAVGAFHGGFSPLFTEPTNRRMLVDVKIDDDAGSNYYVAGLTVSAPIPGQPNAVLFVVSFDYTGMIYIGQGQTYVPTGIAWTANRWKSLSVELTQTGITYTYDGRTFNAGFFNATLGASALIEQAALYSDNYQDVGQGSFSGPTVPANGRFDNLALVPSPGPAALAALAASASLRRRRR